jgi:hypothetical protein
MVCFSFAAGSRSDPIARSRRGVEHSRLPLPYLHGARLWPRRFAIFSASARPLVLRASGAVFVPPGGQLGVAIVERATAPGNDRAARRWRKWRATSTRSTFEEGERRRSTSWSSIARSTSTSRSPSCHGCAAGRPQQTPTSRGEIVSPHELAYDRAPDFAATISGLLAPYRDLWLLGIATGTQGRSSSTRSCVSTGIRRLARLWWAPACAGRRRAGVRALGGRSPARRRRAPRRRDPVLRRLRPRPRPDRPAAAALPVPPLFHACFAAG